MSTRPFPQGSCIEAIEDPRHWRDGDPAFARFVSDGFKRLYADDLET